MMKSSQAKPTSVTREVLREIINSNNSQQQSLNLPTKRRQSVGPKQSVISQISTNLDKLRMVEGIAYLERKIQRQNTELKILSETLSKQITLKDDVLLMLNEQKNRNAQTSKLLTNANKHIKQLKAKLEKRSDELGQKSKCKEEYEMKINKYRDIVRKKDELLTKSQQKIDELLGSQRTVIALENENQHLKELMARFKFKEGTVEKDCLHLRETNCQLQERLRKAQEELMMLRESYSRLEEEFCELSEMYNNEGKESKTIEQDMRNLLELQNNQIQTLRSEKENTEKMLSLDHSNAQNDDSSHKYVASSGLQVNVYRNEIRRILADHIIDNNLRKKVDRDIITTLAEMEKGFVKIARQLMITQGMSQL